MKNNVTLPLGSLSVRYKIESDYGLISALFICFLATAMINLTLNSCKDPNVKNSKLLRKYLGI